ncbi:MAG: 4-hydroxy-3-methylbut-2-enyl diphosphate reductase, partial [Ferruginibacter sp.]
LVAQEADLAIVVGGYNSSNTSHLVELCEEKLATYFISSADKFTSETITHFDLHLKKEIITNNFLPTKQPIKILITSGASCPDAVVQSVIEKLNSFFDTKISVEEIGNSLS